MKRILLKTGDTIKILVPESFSYMRYNGDDAYIVTQADIDVMENHPKVQFLDGKVQPRTERIHRERSANPRVEIRVLKNKLADTDYKAIKFMEGEFPTDEFEAVKRERAEWRRRIREIENEVLSGLSQ